MKNGIFLAAAAAALSLTIVSVPGVSFAETIRIQVSDIDFSTSAGNAAFEARVTVAAARMCESYGRAYSAPYKACVRAVQEDAHDSLAAQLHKPLKVAQTHSPS